MLNFHSMFVEVDLDGNILEYQYMLAKDASFV